MLFQDKPWVFGHLVQLQRRMGKESSFPLIDQTFYPDHREMVSNASFCITRSYNCAGVCSSPRHTVVCGFGGKYPGRKQ